MSEGKHERIAKALAMHEEMGLIDGWQREGKDYVIDFPCPDGWLSGGQFTCHGAREAHVFINGLASAARAVDWGIARKSTVAQVHDHLVATGQLARTPADAARVTKDAPLDVQQGTRPASRVRNTQFGPMHD